MYLFIRAHTDFTVSGCYSMEPAVTYHPTVPVRLFFWVTFFYVQPRYGFFSSGNIAGSRFQNAVYYVHLPFG